jgi:hypothetical protein
MYSLWTVAILINGKMRLSFIDSDLLYSSFRANPFSRSLVNGNVSLKKSLLTFVNNHVSWCAWLKCGRSWVRNLINSTFLRLTLPFTRLLENVIICLYILRQEQTRLLARLLENFLLYLYNYSQREHLEVPLSALNI